MHIYKKGNNMKHLAFTSLVRLILAYGVLCWDPYREGHISAVLGSIQRRSDKCCVGIHTEKVR